MSQNFVEITLDTTAPSVEIFAPNTTTIDTDTLYRIEGNEPLENIQEFYFIDASGVRHDISLLYYGTYFEGTVSFDAFAEGMATLYVRLHDEVLNRSSLYEHNVVVYGDRVSDMQPLTLEIGMKIRAIAKTSHKPYVLSISAKPTFKIESEIMTNGRTEGSE